MWTRRATALLAGSCIFYVIGLANNLWAAYFLAGGALAWLALSGLLAWRLGRRVEVSRTVGTPHVYVAEPVPVSISLTTAGPQTVTVREHVRNLTLDETQEVRWLAETAGQPRVLRDKLTLERRGHHRFEGVVAEVGDPLGLFRRQRRSGRTFDLMVYPRPLRLPHFPLFGMAALGLSDARIDRQAGEAGDFYGVRPYQQGDELRHIHWKTTAHSGRLSIKQYQRRATSATTIYLDCAADAHAGRQQASTLEQCVQAAADFAGYVCEERSPLRLVQAGEKLKVVPSDRGERQLTRVLEVLALAKADGGTTLAQVIDGDQGAHLGSGTVVAITPAADRELTRALLTIRSRGASLVVVTTPAHLYGGGSEAQSTEMFRALATAGATVYRLGPGDTMAGAMRAGGSWR